MPTVRSAAIYARISSDQDGTALGVTRQLEDCRKLAADRGWTIGDEYVDNDVCAYKHRRRPQYARMVTDLQDGLRPDSFAGNSAKMRAMKKGQRSLREI
jgi:DNA invertase Pin-like site-specific DNA recombinase